MTRIQLAALALLAGCQFATTGVPRDVDDDGGVADDAAAIFDGPAGPIDAARDAAAIDASVDAEPGCDSAACVTAGGVCDGASGRCVITTALPGGVVCPAGQFCEVHCEGNVACKEGGVDCSAAAGCDVRCIGTDACQSGAITCGGDACVVLCIGTNACQSGGVDCAATACEVTCDGANACQAGIHCEPATSCEAHCCGGNACQGSTCACSEDAACA